MRDSIQFNSIQCDAMRCDAMRCDAMRCDAMRCDAMRCDAMQCGAFKRAFAMCFKSKDKLWPLLLVYKYCLNAQCRPIQILIRSLPFETPYFEITPCLQLRLKNLMQNACTASLKSLKHRLSAPAVDLPQRGLANTQIAISIRSKNTDQRNKVCYGLCMVLAPLNMALALSWVTVESFGTLPKERLMLAPIC
ncbi:hypothetical protein M011DRAFT_331021 [Sporormia fimetaria CBS 119925]|uniref:Uncharacterized protein n=1 Tax=Sporormia fimetaria CBS 119925 TaxID=1340428 RepID=A0A6A6UW50_9PLEO|nr:hypothetical protein M011DRAFT_331021 [Sporormia fimetaria CBS 119925]